MTHIVGHYNRCLRIWQILSLLLLVAVPAQAQKQNNIWYFGYGSGVDFNGATPVALENGVMRSYEAAASISDPETGELLFYTDGRTVWNRNHSPMPSGSDLFGHNSSTQGALIVPMPGNPSRYYIFTTDAFDRRNVFGQNYSIVDMTREGGLGDVILNNQPLLRPAVEGQCAYRVCGRDEYWVVGHALEGNAFHAWRITETGIAPAVVSRTGQVRVGAGNGSVGAMVFSNDGSKLVSIDYTSNAAELFRFDPGTGILSNPLRLPCGVPPFEIYGACFSPDNSKLYVSTIRSGVFQFNLSLGDSASIVRSRTQLGSGRTGALQLGPDDRIYVSSQVNNALDVIQYPDSAGTACGYSVKEITFPTIQIDLALPTQITSNPDLYRRAAGRVFDLCAGGSIPLVAKSGRTYRWSPSTDLSCTNCQIPKASPKKTTTYTVETSGRYGCSVVDTFTVVVHPALNANASATRQFICQGDSVRLSGQGSGTYVWSPASGLSCTTCPDPVATPDTTTLYILTVTGPSGCTIADSVLITVRPAPQADAGAQDTTICAGGSAQLSASGGERYLWSPAEGLSCTDCPDPVATPATSTTYRLIAYNPGNCSSSDSITVNVAPPPDLATTADTTICRGASIRLAVAGANDVQWSPSEGLSCVDCETPVATPDRTTTYYVSGTGSNGCPATDSVTIVVVEQPTLSLSGDSIICLGSQARVMATGGDTYVWSSPDILLDCPGCPEQSFIANEKVRLYVEAKSAGGCSVTDSFTVEVQASPDIVASGDGDLCAGESRPLHVSGAASYRWEPAESLSCSDCADPVASPASTTTYRVIGSMPGGCSDTATVTLTLRNRELANASIERNVPLSIGERRTLMVTIDRDITTDTLEFDLGWRRGVIGLDGVAASPSMVADGWTEEVLGRTDSSYRSRFVRSSPGYLPAGEMIELTVTGYLGDSAVSDLPFTLTASSLCSAIESRAGSVVIDSICGLDSRMIVITDGMPRLDMPTPHPVVGRGAIRYAVPFDADDVELSLIDAAGDSRLLADGYHAAGEYDLVLDAAEITPGMYVIRLRIGELIRQVEVIVVR